MRAWLLTGTQDITEDGSPLKLADVITPVPEPNEILIRVFCCGVCHTELDEIEGRTPPPTYPVIPGHQVIGAVADCGISAKRFRQGERVGVAWINSACGQCEFCVSGLENLCSNFRATGRDANGGYAEFMAVREEFAYRIPDVFEDGEAAPLLCAGAIGYRSLRLSNLKDGNVLALSGFGASAHLVLKTAKYLYPKLRIFVFARRAEEQRFALELGCEWAGDFTNSPPDLANAIIDTTPAWQPIVSSLSVLKPGGRLVINAIRKESIDQKNLMNLIYQDHLWMEKEVKSVANITRKDVEEFLAIAASIPIKPEVEIYPFERANEALTDLKHKHVRGAKVLLVGPS